ncbi:glycosyltransferase family 4 protein [Persicobacter sp. CCB-QB2]|uniref:glycosyltransferase family 4 protein n=1 Tax=Persicobacter sp. CCB-QB2 TaxID=1561025 RepID=UPI0006A99A4B|nr:glycosyltransferase family 4 protein [Persicobacter sp. CCB-QB2]
MQILLLSSDGLHNGASHSICYLADGLARRGHTVVLGCKKDSYIWSRGKSYGTFIVEALDFKSKFALRDQLQLKAVIQKHNIQIINAQESKDRYLSMLVNKFFKLGLKVFHTRRQRPLSVGGKIQNSLYLKGTDKMIVISDALKQTFIEKGFPAHHLEVISNGLPFEGKSNASEYALMQLKEKYSIPLEKRLIGCFARHKCQDQLVRALEHVEQDACLLLAGVEKNVFDELVAEHQIKNKIIYLGMLPREEILPLYEILDLFVLPSDSDGFGLVLVEAMMKGVPVIGTRMHGIISVINEEKNGLWFEHGDHQQLAEKINLYLNNEDIRQKYIQAGLKAAREEFSIETTVKNYETFFQSYLPAEVIMENESLLTL